MHRVDGRFPVISITLKSTKQPTLVSAFDKLKKEISAEFRRHSFIENASGLTDTECRRFHQLMEEQASYDDYSDSLK